MGSKPTDVVTVFALLRLKPGAVVEAYEQWVRESDVPVAAATPSIGRYEVHRISGSLDGSDPAYQYVEVIEITDRAQFAEDMNSEQSRRAAREIQKYVSGSYIVGERIG